MATHYRGSKDRVRALDAYVKLMRAADTVSGRIDRELRKRGLTESQFGILEMLHHVGPLRQCDIGTKLLISRANVTLVVDWLAAKGWVRRDRNETDRRSNVVQLTPEGRRRIEALFPDHAARIAALFSPLDAAEQEELARLCKKLGLAAATDGDL